MTDEPTMKDIGTKGGTTTARTYGPEYFRELGKKGGAALRDTRGSDHFSKIGSKGGSRVPGHARERAGKLGGTTTKERMTAKDPDYYRKLAYLALTKRRENAERRKNLPYGEKKRPSRLPSPSSPKSTEKRAQTASGTLPKITVPATERTIVQKLTPEERELLNAAWNKLVGRPNTIEEKPE